MRARTRAHKFATSSRERRLAFYANSALLSRRTRTRARAYEKSAAAVARLPPLPKIRVCAPRVAGRPTFVHLRRHSPLAAGGNGDGGGDAEAAATATATAAAAAAPPVAVVAGRALVDESVVLAVEGVREGRDVVTPTLTGAAAALAAATVVQLASSNGGGGDAAGAQPAATVIRFALERPLERSTPSRWSAARRSRLCRMLSIVG